ncbi:hypothetical protein [Malonomonas rubra]|uniref:hypothetical protein n=1 Tax=Malonomonas rubra TaxID=57040 RepID=UPI0026EC57D6|nr:hypothetical protein [Malonomonas rubra]
MTIRNRLFILYLLAVLVILTGGVVSLWQFGIIERNYHSFSEESVRAVGLLQNIHIQGSTLFTEILEIYSLYSIRKTAERRKWIAADDAEINHTRQQLLAYLEEYQNLAKDPSVTENSLLKLLETEIGQMVQMSHVSGAKSVEAVDSLSLSLQWKREFEEIETSFQEIVTLLMNQERREADRRNSIVVEAIKTAKIRLAYMFAPAIGAALFLVQFLFQRFVNGFERH